MTRGLREVHGVSLAEQATESIRRAILDGTFKPDERITIEQIAAELGISRTPVREALKALEGNGLVKLLPHRGAVVERFAREDVYHRYSIRAMLEGYAAEVACRADAERVAGLLEDNCRRMLAATEGLGATATTGTLVELNQEFHSAIHEAARSPTLQRQLGMLRNPDAYSRHYWTRRENQLAALEMHEAIAAAFRAGKPVQARRLMTRHILAARDLVLDAQVGAELPVAAPEPEALTR